MNNTKYRLDVISLLADIVSQMDAGHLIEKDVLLAESQILKLKAECEVDKLSVKGAA